MKLNDVIKAATKFSKPFRVDNGKDFRLKNVDPGDTLRARLRSQAAGEGGAATGIEALAELQDMLYAQDRWGVLLIFQAMDAAGKDGAIKHVMSGVNPQGCQVASFKAPSSEDLDHDFLWRCQKHLPERGRIGIFNRSYYEETLVVRVHPELLEKQKVPPKLITKRCLGTPVPRYPGLSNATSATTASSSASSSSTSRATSRSAASSSGSITR